MNTALLCQRCQAQLQGADNESTLSALEKVGRGPSKYSKGDNRALLPPERIEYYERVTGQKALVDPRDEGTHDRGTESFVVLPQTASTPLSGTIDSLTSRMERASKLSDILSAKSDIDHPLCTDCADALMEGMARRLQEASQERDAYLEFLRVVKTQTPDPQDLDKAESETRQIEEEIKAAHEQLSRLESEQKETDRLLEEARLESEQVTAQEQQIYRERNRLRLEQEEAETELGRMQRKIATDSSQLERLRKTNVYNDAFCIGHDGHFGTINGLRLGRLPGIPVDWSEINAAWGLTVLLLDTVAERLGYRFKGYELRPMGSTCTIVKWDAQGHASILELFTTGDFTQRLFMHRKFDAAMVAFLDCLEQMGTYAVSLDPSLTLPYKIDRDRIGDACIRLAFNQDESWTRACKFVLTNVKWILAFCSNMTNKQRQRPG